MDDRIGQFLSRPGGAILLGSERELMAQRANLKALALGRTRAAVVPAGGAGLVSIIVLLHDNLELTRQCVASVYAHTHGDFELILVDNGSREEVGGYFVELSGAHANVITVRNQDNRGYAAGCNQGLALARGAYLVLLNNDVIVTPGWLSRQLAWFEADPAIGLVGPRTNYSAGVQKVDLAAYRDVRELYAFAEQWSRAHAGEAWRVHRITGVCMVIRREALDRVGGLDPAFGIGNFEDDDYCLRMLRAGYQIVVANDVFVHHYGSATFKAMQVDYAALMTANWQVFCAKWPHAGEPGAGYEALVLARARPFDPERDHIPLRPVEPRTSGLGCC